MFIGDFDAQYVIPPTIYSVISVPASSPRRTSRYPWRVTISSVGAAGRGKNHSAFRVSTAQEKQGKWGEKSLSGKMQGIWKFDQNTGKTQGIFFFFFFFETAFIYTETSSGWASSPFHSSLQLGFGLLNL